MKRLVRWIVVLGLAGSLASCGLPGAAARTVSNTVKGAVSTVKNTANSVSSL